MFYKLLKMTIRERSIEPQNMLNYKTRFNKYNLLFKTYERRYVFSMFRSNSYVKIIFI